MWGESVSFPPDVLGSVGPVSYFLFFPIEAFRLLCFDTVVFLFTLVMAIILGQVVRIVLWRTVIVIVLFGNRCLFLSVVRVGISWLNVTTHLQVARLLCVRIHRVFRIPVTSIQTCTQLRILTCQHFLLYFLLLLLLSPFLLLERLLSFSFPSFQLVLWNGLHRLSALFDGNLSLIFLPFVDLTI